MSGPSARESTGARAITDTDTLVRPVSAGIDGECRSTRTAAPCPARKRGNRRTMVWPMPSAAVSGPSARESTGPNALISVPGDVRPGRTGIDGRPPAPGPRTRSPARTRGNRRSVSGEGQLTCTSGQYTRESTVDEECNSAVVKVHPVHAGIYGSEGRRGRARRRLACTRENRRLAGSTSKTSVQSHPCAGNRHPSRPRPLAARVSNPCARESTDPAVAHVRRVGVPPVRAGIDGCRSRRPGADGGPTRMRGNRRAFHDSAAPWPYVQPVRAGNDGTAGQGWHRCPVPGAPVPRCPGAYGNRRPLWKRRDVKKLSGPHARESTDGGADYREARCVRPGPILDTRQLARSPPRTHANRRPQDTRPKRAGLSSPYARESTGEEEGQQEEGRSTGEGRPPVERPVVRPTRGNRREWALALGIAALSGPYAWESTAAQAPARSRSRSPARTHGNRRKPAGPDCEGAMSDPYARE